MKKKNKVTAIMAAVVSVLMMLSLLGSCKGKETDNVSDEPSEVESVAGMKDGERFEDVIMLEGMEETVHYEHVRNEIAGYELDYDYERLNRSGSKEQEQFVSGYDDPEKPVNYLEVTSKAGDTDAVVKSVKADLSKKYSKIDIEKQYELDRAGACVLISASKGKKGKAQADSLVTAYIIPAGDSCIVATAHCTVESAEGFGERFTGIVNTISVIDK